MENSEQDDEQLAWSQAIPNYGNKLLKRLDEFRKTTALYDVCIHAGNGDFNAHKVILAACGGIFRTCFVDEDKKMINDTREISLDCPAQGLKPIIRFAYSGSLVVTKRNAVATMMAAEVTKMKEVQKVCAEIATKEYGWLVKHSDEKTPALIEKLKQLLQIHSQCFASNKDVNGVTEFDGSQKLPFTDEVDAEISEHATTYYLFAKTLKTAEAIIQSEVSETVNNANENKRTEANAIVKAENAASPAPAIRKTEARGGKVSQTQTRETAAITSFCKPQCDNSNHIATKIADKDNASDSVAVNKDTKHLSQESSSHSSQPRPSSPSKSADTQECAVTRPHVDETNESIKSGASMTAKQQVNARLAVIQGVDETSEKQKTINNETKPEKSSTSSSIHAKIPREIIPTPQKTDKSSTSVPVPSTGVTAEDHISKIPGHDTLTASKSSPCDAGTLPATSDVTVKTPRKDIPPPAPRNKSVPIRPGMVASPPSAELAVKTPRKDIPPPSPRPKSIPNHSDPTVSPTTNDLTANTPKKHIPTQSTTTKSKHCDEVIASVGAEPVVKTPRKDIPPPAPRNKTATSHSEATSSPDTVTQTGRDVPPPTPRTASAPKHPDTTTSSIVSDLASNTPKKDIPPPSPRAKSASNHTASAASEGAVDQASKTSKRGAPPPTPRTKSASKHPEVTASPVAANVAATTPKIDIPPPSPRSKMPASSNSAVNDTSSTTNGESTKPELLKPTACDDVPAPSPKVKPRASMKVKKAPPPPPSTCTKTASDVTAAEKPPAPRRPAKAPSKVPPPRPKPPVKKKASNNIADVSQTPTPPEEYDDSLNPFA